MGNEDCEIYISSYTPINPLLREYYRVVCNQNEESGIQDYKIEQDKDCIYLNVTLTPEASKEFIEYLILEDAHENK